MSDIAVGRSKVTIHRNPLHINVTAHDSNSIKVSAFRISTVLIAGLEGLATGSLWRKAVIHQSASLAIF
jgi:hypothetical protein